MRDKFPGYYRPNVEEFAELWGEALFVLDANVLLNLYRYPKMARDELVSVLVQVSDRLWIPFQAALEFQRNRPYVLAEQKERFYQVRKILNKALSTLEGDLGKLQLGKRHSLIETDTLLNVLRSSVDKFNSSLEQLEAQQIGAHEDDLLRLRIDELLGGHVGDPPATQSVVDSISEEGKQRYSQKIPPGYSDSRKEDGASASYSYGGIVYEAEYGDLILWKQLIDRAKHATTKSVIFVTDDQKEDWWWIIDSQGKKTLGPRPELINEIQRLANIDQFYIYNSEQFLEFSKRFLQSSVSDESIEQVRQVAQSTRAKYAQATAISSIGENEAVAAVQRWLGRRFSESLMYVLQEGHFPDMVVQVQGTHLQLGIDVKIVSTTEAFKKALPNTVNQAVRYLEEKKHSSLELVFVFRSMIEVPDVVQLIDFARPYVLANVDIVLGIVFDNDIGEYEFFELGRA